MLLQNIIVMLPCQQILGYKKFPNIQNYPTPTLLSKKKKFQVPVLSMKKLGFPGISKCSFREGKSMSRDIKLNKP